MNSKRIILAIFLITFIFYGCKQNSNEVNSIDIFKQKDTLEIFAPEMVSTYLNQRDIAISSDGTEIYYTLSTFDNSFRSIVRIELENSKPILTEIASFSGEYNDIEPFISSSGEKLFFASDRPDNLNDSIKDYNIWVVERTELQWGEPKILSSVINTSEDEFYPSVAENGNLYFTAAYQNSMGLEDIYKSEFIDGNYTTPISLDSAINSSMYEFNAYISPDEKIIVFSSYGRFDDQGGGDLYFSKKDESGKWLPAVNMGNTINSESLDYCPFIDFKRGNFYFTSNRRQKKYKKLNLNELIKESEQILNGMGNIYYINLSETLINK